MSIVINGKETKNIDSFKPGQLVAYRSNWSGNTVCLLLDEIPNMRHTFSAITLSPGRPPALISRCYIHPKEFRLFDGSVTLANDKE